MEIEKMKIKVCANYDQIDKQNIEMFREYGTGQSEEDSYKCVICGKEACIRIRK